MSGPPALSTKNGNERVRRLVHLGFGACAFLVVPLGRGWSIVLAAAAVVYNVGIAPALRLDASYRRAGERLFHGLSTYPLAVLLLLLVAPLPVAAGAWLVLAAGDPAAAIVGSRWRRPAVPWNPRKSLCGTAAGFLAGSLACMLFGAIEAGPAAIPASLAAGAGGALAESLPLPIDDNLAVAAAAAAVLWLFSA